MCLMSILISSAVSTTPIAYAQGLKSNGYWLVYTTLEASGGTSRNGDTLWAANADGSAAIKMFSGADIWQISASPNDHTIAFISANSDSQLEPQNLHLRLAHLPNGTVTDITPLTNTKTEPPPGIRSYTAEAISNYPTLAWSPDGKWLAFVGAQAGTSSDLYVYSVQTHKVSQLTSGPTEMYQVVWSPDSKYIAHFGVNGFGSGAGMSMDQAWVAAADGSAVKSLYKIDSADEKIVGWTAPDTLILQSWDVDCGWHHLRTFNITSKIEKTLYANYYDDAAYSPTWNSLLISSGGSPSGATCTGTNLPYEAGLFLVTPGQQPQKLAAAAGFVWWSPELSTFIETSDIQYKVINTVSREGKIAPFASQVATRFYPSPDGKTLAWIDDTNQLNVGKAVVAKNAHIVLWAP